ncbi:MULTISPECIES: FecCD family ABC transporter permease [unclassified Nocardioides]|uniref:FecCD family ABC transporter permease n=1 Tax=unclassified Nocardioides TaxID=2615069 RepID=UPI0006F3386B|nr:MULTISPECIES: iron chelate uptake ABC transporter family permease subunit [unclassified Nocardioides]KRA32405.1 iron ABC transporter permease [Nocardioides sp. Root614]KRA89058.1 iron ABC transporter permease [Nocardioides sp. Root682]
MTTSQRSSSPTAAATAVVVRRHRLSRHRRAAVVPAALLAVALLLALLTLCCGSVRLTFGQVLGSLLGTGDNAAVDFIVQDLAVPQVKAAIGVGLALGAAGTIFQQLLRNPLASPDFVGISAGASVFAVAGLAVPALSGLSIPVLALTGALVFASAMYLLAWRDGVSGYRFILIGIGMSAFATSITGYLLTRTSLTEAREALHWLTGSIGQAGDTENNVLLVCLLLLAPTVPVLQRMLRNVELGDDTARGLGTRLEPTRLILLGVGVLLTALATAVAGPIAFVALVAGPVADRLLGPARGGIVAAGAVGAILCLVADYVAVQVLPVEMPTGVVTGAVGAPYLLWLLATTNRRGVGG